MHTAQETDVHVTIRRYPDRPDLTIISGFGVAFLHGGFVGAVLSAIRLGGSARLWMVVGSLVLAVVGVVVMYLAERAYRKSRPPPAAPPADLDHGGQPGSAGPSGVDALEQQWVRGGAKTRDRDIQNPFA